jgi:hypothetical protein
MVRRRLEKRRRKHVVGLRAQALPVALDEDARRSELADGARDAGAHGLNLRVHRPTVPAKVIGANADKPEVCVKADEREPTVGNRYRKNRTWKMRDSHSEMCFTSSVRSSLVFRVLPLCMLGIEVCDIGTKRPGDREESECRGHPDSALIPPELTNRDPRSFGERRLAHGTPVPEAAKFGDAVRKHDRRMVASLGSGLN